MEKHSPKLPLGADQLEALIAPLLAEVLSRSRSLPALIDTLVPLTRNQQARMLHWVEVISRTNAELAYQFATFAPQALEKMTLPEIDEWVLQAMNTYDHQGLYAATGELKYVDRYIRERHLRKQSLELGAVSKVLESFIQGLSGRRLAIEADDQPWTDTETIYLPRRISVFNNQEENFLIYKAASTLLWAQTRFGTFSSNAEGELKLAALAAYDDAESASAIFMSLETERLLYQIAIELPGLGRQMIALAGEHKLGPRWENEIMRLQSDTATVDDTLQAVARLYPAEPPEPPVFQAKLFVPEATRAIQMRISSEREQLQQMLEQMLPEHIKEQMRRRNHPDAAGEAEDGLKLRVVEKMDSSDSSFELSFNGTAFAASPELNQLLLSILQDLGEIPLDYLVSGGSADPRTPQATPIELPRSDEDVNNGLPYPEWDHRRGSYRQDWCFLRETDVEDGPEDFVVTTLSKYAAVLPQLRKSFEALRGEDRWLRRQLSGDEIDIDAAVDAIADSLSGREPSERLYTRLSRIDRNIAVMLMIDMSGSTKGWVNDAEREALVLLCQALEILGDRYAIYGFSGMTRKQCDLYKIKEFSEPYSANIDRRISGISAKDYTRMGVTIRHLNKLLEATPARTKLLITLSDGKPEDFDGYGGEYGIEDTRQALIESRRLGIHPFCITIDTEASNYLPHMYGTYNYAVVDNVRDLPLRVADVYRRLTH
jgi:nitric oxide reductase NorD protein